METQQLTSVGGLMQNALTSPVNGFEDLGAQVVDVNDLPTPDPFRLPLLTFTAPASGNETVSWNAGGNVTVHWGDGTSDGNKSHAYTGLTPGEQITISLESPYRFGFSANADLKDLDNTTFWWDGVANTSSTLNLKDMGITRRMTPTMSATYSTLNLEGNSIEGEFPSGIAFNGNCFIKNNKFTGNLPGITSFIKKYQIQGNSFIGDIHDISNYSLIESYLAYGQDDGNSYHRANDPKIMLTGEIPNLSTCAALTFYHVGAGEPWNRGFKNDLSLASDFDVTNKLSRFYASNCLLSTAEIDKLLNAFANAGTTSPNIIDISGSNGYPTSAGLADKDTLVAAGWTVNLPVQ
tara:strand:+ start:25 stop:1074 length:1050 start_codon:yes stop_codon:yes gene_type:complete